VRIRPNQEMPNQILDNHASSKYCEKINDQIEHKNSLADDDQWLGYSWFYYSNIIYGEFNFPTLQQLIDGFMEEFIQKIEE
jgi:hypothetical protein